MWIRRCTNCGYCAKRLDLSSNGIASIISNHEYQQALGDARYSDTTNKFRCAGMIQKRNGDLQAYIWTQIHLAWIFDDLDGNPAQESINFRSISIEGRQRLHDANSTLTEHYDIDVAIQTDLLRRTGRFGEAQKLINTFFEIVERPNVKKSLMYQEKLIAQEDTSCHSLGAAMRAYSKLFPGSRYGKG
jgi:hypothetical protein